MEEGLESGQQTPVDEERTVISGRRLAVGGQRSVASAQQAAQQPSEGFEGDEVMENVVRTPRKGDKVAKGVAKVLGGDILSDKLVLKQIPLLLLCLFFLLLVVANRYKVENLSREKKATEERINELREQRIQMQRHYQESVKISQIAEELRESGVGITNGPPYEL